ERATFSSYRWIWSGKDTARAEANSSMTNLSSAFDHCRASDRLACQPSSRLQTCLCECSSQLRERYPSRTKAFLSTRIRLGSITFKLWVFLLSKGATSVNTTERERRAW